MLLHPLLATGGWAWPTDLQPLLAALRRHRFSVQLGIARQTLLHEAAHAAQSCPDRVLRPIGWRLPLSPLIEREVSAVQGQADAVALIVRALDQRCRPGAG